MRHKENALFTILYRYLLYTSSKIKGYTGITVWTQVTFSDTDNIHGLG